MRGLIAWSVFRVPDLDDLSNDPGAEAANSEGATRETSGDRETFWVRASELADEENVIFAHPINQQQLFGSPGVGHSGVANLSNEDLTRLGGPSGNDPISGTRYFGSKDTMEGPGSIIEVTAGNHRVAEIGRRVRAGMLSGDTLVEIVRSQ